MHSFVGSITILFMMLCTQSSAWNSPVSKKDSRRQFLRKTLGGIASLTGAALGSSNLAAAAPPIAVIAEELGYFPVQNREGQVMYIPKKVQRKST